MSFRSRPILDRKHRPRWQDELRTQQLTVVGFAVAIALAIGIFGAAAWNGYWDAHLRPVAAVAGETFDRSDLDERLRILVAESVATLTDLQSQLSGGPRDQFLDQQIQSIQGQLQSLDGSAAESLVQSAVLAGQADAYGVSVTEDEVDDGIAERFATPDRVLAQLVLVDPLPADADADADAEPTEEQIATARAEAESALERLEGGEEFATVATAVSDDFTASAGGMLGWFDSADPAYGEYFGELADADVGDFVGPIESERGFAVLELLDRREATTDGPLRQALTAQGIDDGTYRDYVRGELLLEAYRTR